MIVSSEVIERWGLKACIMCGSLLMLFGSTLRILVTAYHDNFWPVFFGHIISLCASAFLRNPVTKLTNNWFGQHERGFATGVSIMSGPAGIFISKILIQSLMYNDDKLEEHRHRAKLNFEFFILANAFIVSLMILPGFFLIKDHPPTPPNRRASKPLQHFSVLEGIKMLISNKEYMLIFIHF